MRTLSIATLTGLAIILGGCGSDAAVNKVAIEKSVTDVEKSMLKAVDARDASAFASNYAPDAIAMVPGAAAARGRDAIQAEMTPYMADPNFKLDFASDRVEVSDAGDMAATRGSYTLTATDPATKRVINDKGSYVTVFKKQKDGAWKAVFDINTSEVPPTPPPAPKAAKTKPARAAKKGKKR